MADEDLERVLIGLDGARRAGFAQMYDERRRAEHAERQWQLWADHADHLQAVIDQMETDPAYERGVNEGRQQVLSEQRGRHDEAHAAALSALLRLQLESRPLMARVADAVQILETLIESETDRSHSAQSSPNQ